MQLTKEIKEPVWAIGLMSGTSLDGVDAALLQTDGQSVSGAGGAISLPYEPAFQEQLREVLAGGGDLLLVEKELTLKHAEAVNALLKKKNLKPESIAVIGFHGQTIVHRPDEGMTFQLGNPSLLAEMTGINVVSDFRRWDMAAGGQGAPLVPVFHQALMTEEDGPVAVLNIGGVANVTWIGEHGELIAFDTGPGNALINDWVYQHTGKAYDEDGELAAQANQVDEELLAQLLAHEYFSCKPPKSLDRNSFGVEIIQKLSLESGAATLTAFTIESIAKAAEHFPAEVEHWYICGGGRLNPTLMAGLEEKLGKGNVSPVETLGYNGDALEAQAFAYLAVRSLRGLPLTFPKTTGVNVPVSGGVLTCANT